MTLTRQETVIHIIQAEGHCMHVDYCPRCAIEDECQAQGRSCEEVKKLAIEIFLEEFGTKADLLEVLI